MGRYLSWFIEELSRRRVIRVVATYAIGTFGALQSADVIVSALGLPHVLMTALVVTTFVGLPVAAVLAWMFDLTPEGIVRTPSIASPSQEELATALAGLPPTPRRSRIGLVIGALALLLGIIGLNFWWRARHQKPLPHDVIAVLPFTVGGSEQYGYLREGVAQLLSTGISGGGALQTVDQRALVRAVKESGGEPDDDAGRALSQKFGAGLFVIGSVLEVRDRLRLHAQLYDSTGDNRPLADANAEGEAATLFAMCDDLLRQLRPGLLTNGAPAAGFQLMALAENTTQSLPALKAFIEGDQALGNGDQKGALQALQKAVAEDPSFALAQYRLAVTAGWLDEYPLGRAALYRALREREKLPARERELIEAFFSFWRGRAHEAEMRYRAILEARPDDAESWYQLGEIYFHDGPFQGQPQSAAKPFFEKAAALAPNQKMYTFHLDEVKRIEGDKPATVRLDEALLKSAPESAALLDWDKAWAHNDARRTELESKISDPIALGILAGIVLAHSPEQAGINEAQALLSRASATPNLEAKLAQSLRLESSGIDAISGQHARAGKTLAAVATSEPVLANAIALRALIPFVPHQTAELQAALGALASDHPAQAGPVTLPFEPRLGIGSPAETRRIHDYLAGRISAQLGDAAAAESFAVLLRNSNDSDDSPLGADLALSIRAHSAAAQAHNSEALAFLEQMSGGIPLAIQGNPFLAGPGDRWLHAELLSKAGRHEEALHWFQSILDSDAINEWTAPVHLRCAELLERLGRKKEALDQYQRFASLWQECDEPLRPLVDGARARISALASEQAQ